MKKYIITFFALLTSFFGISQKASDNWIKIQTKYSDMSGVIHAPSKDSLFIHRMDGSLLRSFNGGVTWDSVYIRHDSIRFTDYGSFFLNGKIGFTWGIWGCMYTGIKQERPILLKTTNSGSSWLPIMTGFTENDVNNISLVHFWDANNGFAIASHKTDPSSTSHHSNHIYITYNGGNTWQDGSYPYYPILNYSPRMVSFKDRHNGVMCGTEINFNISATNNGGQEWNNRNIHNFGYNPTGINMIDDNNGFILSNDSVYLTENNFETFTKKKLPFTNYNNTILTNNASFYTLDSKTTYFLTFNDDIYKTNDGFNSFSISKTKGDEPNYSIAGFKNDVYIYSVGGIVYKLNNTSNTNILDGDAFKNNILVYPNPSTTDFISVESSSRIISTYQITNILGQIVEQNNFNGTTINVSNLKSGSYSISLFDINNELIGTNKIVRNSNK